MPAGRSPSPAASHFRRRGVAAILREGFVGAVARCERATSIGELVAILENGGSDALAEVLDELVIRLGQDLFQWLTFKTLGRLHRLFSLWLATGVFVQMLVIRMLVRDGAWRAMLVSNAETSCSMLLRSFCVCWVLWVGGLYLGLSKVCSDLGGLALLIALTIIWIIGDQVAIRALWPVLLSRRWQNARRLLLSNAGPLLALCLLWPSIYTCPSGSKCADMLLWLSPHEQLPAKIEMALDVGASLAHDNTFGIPADITVKDCQVFYPPVSAGRVVKVYDGDTITIAAKIEETIYKFPVRLVGIDTAEMATKNPTEKEAAVLTRDALHGRIFGENVRLADVSYDKYGRLLADVRLGHTSLSEWLIKNNFAVPYNGGTKKPPSDWLKFLAGGYT